MPESGITSLMVGFLAGVGFGSEGGLDDGGDIFAPEVSSRVLVGTFRVVLERSSLARGASSTPSTKIIGFNQILSEPEL